MYIFKTSGQTLESVIKNQKHAFAGKPAEWYVGELALVSKNKNDCLHGEKQVQFIMRIENIRETDNREIESFFPGNSGRWKYIVDCYDTIKLLSPFNLKQTLGEEKAKRYGPVMTFKRFEAIDELAIMTYLENNKSTRQQPIREEQTLIEKSLRKLNELYNLGKTIGKKEQISNRIERDLRITNLLKRLRPDKCQICGIQHFRMNNGGYYSEIHHIVKLSQGGSQATDNCLVLCPTCHRKMHYAGVLLEENGTSKLKITINGIEFNVDRNITAR